MSETGFNVPSTQDIAISLTILRKTWNGKWGEVRCTYKRIESWWNVFALYALRDFDPVKWFEISMDIAFVCSPIYGKLWIEFKFLAHYRARNVSFRGSAPDPAASITTGPNSPLYRIEWGITPLDVPPLDACGVSQLGAFRTSIVSSPNNLSLALPISLHDALWSLSESLSLYLSILLILCC